MTAQPYAVEIFDTDLTADPSTFWVEALATSRDNAITLALCGHQHRRRIGRIIPGPAAPMVAALAARVAAFNRYAADPGSRSAARRYLTACAAYNAWGA